MLGRSRLVLLLTLVLWSTRSAAQDPDPGSLRVIKETATAVHLSWTSATPTTYCVTRDLDPTALPLVAEAPGLTHVDAPPAPPALPAVWYYDVEEAPAG